MACNENSIMSDDDSSVLSLSVAFSPFKSEESEGESSPKCLSMIEPYQHRITWTWHENWGRSRWKKVKLVTLPLWQEVVKLQLYKTERVNYV